MYRVIKNDCRVVNNVSYTIHLRQQYMYYFYLTLSRLMSYIYGTPILDVSRSHTTTQHSR